MSFYHKNHPMLGSDLIFNAWKSRRAAAIFKGTLLGIMVSFLLLFFLAYFLNLAGQFFGIKTAQAATIYQRSDYKAQFFVNSADRLELVPGQEATYKIGFKNTGKAPWLNSGANFISIYTYGPKYRKSNFQGGGWYRSDQPAKLKEIKADTGQLGYIEFKLKASAKEGNYTEVFKLAAENKAWIEGGEFSVPIIVKTKQVKAIAPFGSELGAVELPVVGSAPPVAGSNFQGSLMIKSADKVQAKAGEVVDLRLGFKNTGKVAWDMRGIVVPEETLEGDGRSIFYNPTWTSGHQPMVIGDIATKPGEVGYVDFKIKTPEAAGTYNAKFKLVVNYDHEVVGGEAEIPVYVTDESARADQAGRVTQNINMIEPILEIGLDYIENSSQAVELVSDQPYQLTDKNGNILASFSAYESTRATYNFSTKIFTIQNARLNLQAEGELHFKGLNANTIFTILSMSRLTSDGINDNKYRDEIVLRYADTTGRLWTINRLSMEHYLWGIAETSNISPIEYIKSIIVASRTYALYHYLNPYKYNGYFTMRATTADQLYRGYQSELRRSRVVQAVNETAGQVITYQKDVVVTPYFGHSDGQTRTWSSVFGGKDKAWLVPVAAPYDAGLEMFGHGVGMSANDAYGHAKTDGWDYTRILKYYYNGIEVAKVY